jgi:hypothetical protein
VSELPEVVELLERSERKKRTRKKKRGFVMRKRVEVAHEQGAIAT